MVTATPGSLLDYAIKLDTGVPCGKGWEGTRPGCKRAKKAGEPAKPAAKSKSRASSQSKSKVLGDLKEAIAQEPKTKATSKKAKESKPDQKTNVEPAGAAFTPVEGSAKNMRSIAKSLTGWQNDVGKRMKKDRNVYIANSSMINEIYSNHAAKPENTRILKDAKGNMQAAASIQEKKDSLYIEYLATAPWNVKGGEAKSVKGAGTAMIEHIIQESVKKGKGGSVTLESLPDAISFYEKIGFKNLGQAADYNDGVVSMKLDAKAAQEFLKKRGKV